ncbi:MAG TPA: hypothetical protein VJ203_02135 [Bacteroidales bacterium]|nr:hypothetical protein [Bacteroidales bacterium]
MKQLFILMLIYGILPGCSEDEIPGEKTNPEQPVAMYVYCQTNTGNILRRIEYVYDMGKLVSETTLIDNEIYSTTTFEYNSALQLIRETYATLLSTLEKSYEYNVANQLINIIHKRTDYDMVGQVVNVQETEAPLEYENDLLVRKGEYWGGFSTYTYENGRLITMNEHTASGQLHHITTYIYSGDLKVEEKKVTAAGAIIYIRIFQYDFRDRLTRITEGEHTIEVNTYLGNKLTEKKTYYFGIDPGFDVCYGNYIYKYEYQ